MDNQKVDVEQLANEYVSKHPNKDVRSMYGSHYRAFIEGSKALQSNAGEFSLEDIKEIIKMARKIEYITEGEMKFEYSIEKIIQSLTKEQSKK